jgi:hypothetical protein
MWHSSVNQGFFFLLQIRKLLLRGFKMETTPHGYVWLTSFPVQNGRSRILFDGMNMKTACKCWTYQHRHTSEFCFISQGNNQWSVFNLHHIYNTNTNTCKEMCWCVVTLNTVETLTLFKTCHKHQPSHNFNVRFHPYSRVQNCLTIEGKLRNLPFFFPCHSRS